MSTYKFKDVMPRLYEPMVKIIEQQWPALLLQFPQMIITGRCGCGDCVTFNFEVEGLGSPIPSIQNDGAFSDELEGIDGLTVYISIFEENNRIAGIEILDDYDDGYINEKLTEIGFPRDRHAPSDKNHT